MEWTTAAGLLLGSVIALMALGMPVALAFLASNMLGVYLFMGGFSGIYQLIANATSSVTSFILVPVPLFVLMGSLFFHSGLARRVFDALDLCIGNLKGRLAYLTVLNGTIFAALSGSSMANTAMLGSLMVPEMKRRGYKTSLAVGPILGCGGLAILIPPSTLAVLLASLGRIDVGALLVAGILPGLLLAFFYVLLIWLHLRLDPDAAPGYAIAQTSIGRKLRAVVINILPMSLVVFAVVGLIILGIATPSEAAAFGVLAVIILAALFRSLTLDCLRRAAIDGVRITGMTFLILIGSSTFSQILAFSGATSGFIELAADLDLAPFSMLMCMLAVLLVLGMFMDQLSMMLLTLPIFMPVATSFGFDPIWFAVIVLLALEISLITPPFGLLLFVMVGAAPEDIRFDQVVLAGLPYIASAVIVTALIIALPELALFLPSLMR
ncbi:MAG: TRAP transporter large permease [Alphaproteobacteria bacterium]|nr:TRAP transporter large permease [Alphaproteobacteria bacterium]